ncbi:unnamed protein product [Trichogramma brassicae]|uniref:DUF5641 domain-containing protein n=1 Tax=Trichogramma brassicae TaxID=86971 RepID=A0A6H5JAV9_9HYME|nr:unnamed protein product [Trichogramma brassicae]
MEKLSVWTARALDNIKPAQTGAATPTVQFSTTATSLPKLTLPKFSGLQHEWDTFKALFTSMVKDAPTLTPTLKLQHLFACVEGDALRTIKSIEVTGDNFDVAWTALSRRYENKSVHPRSAKSSKPSNSNSSKFVSAHHTSNSDSSARRQPRCLLCSGEHRLGACADFNGYSIEQRWKFVREQGLCFNCLSKAHKGADCTSAFKCRTCQQTHHTKLHRGSTTQDSATSSNTDASSLSNSTSTHVATGAAVASHTSTNERATILGTAQVRAVNSRGEELLVRALIDPASEGSFVTEHVAQMLALPKKSTPLSVSGVGGQVSAKTKASVSMTLYSTNSFNASISLTAAVLPKVSTLLPKRAIDDTRWPHLKGLALADPHYDTPAPVDCLIGAELYPEIVKAGLRKGPIGSPMAYNSIFGWIVTGPTDIQRAHPDVIGSFKLTVVPMESISCELRKFWELEEMQLSPTLTPAEEQCEDYFHSTHRRDETGRFVVRLPLTNTPELPGSYVIAKQRFLSLERRLAKSPELGQQYNKFMQDYEDLHHMRKASPAQSNVKTAYIPHHAVVGKKLRVVFNASQEANNGKSLNDFLHVGGKLQSDISTIILRWRLGRYAFTADIVKMYRQIRIHDEDVPWQRILWRKNPEDPIQEYELLTVTYGTACAPYLALRVMHQLAIDKQAQHPIGSKILQENMYVDDALVSCDSEIEAIQARVDLTEILRSAGMELDKWAANYVTLLPVDSPSLHIRNFDKDTDVSTLGLRWTPRWIAPVVVRAKMLLQHLWLHGHDWDQLADAATTEAWLDYRRQLPELQALRIPRWMGTKINTPAMLHGFSDASERAYAAAIYLVGENSVHLIAAKSKVAPIRSVSLPRLELCGATLLARLLSKVVQDLKGPELSIRCWTDSQVVLAWLRAPPCTWKVFVANRVSEIHSLLPTASWGHVTSKENPADVASRGCPPGHIKNDLLWWHGPSWLLSSRTSPTTEGMEPSTELERRTERRCFATTKEDNIETVLDRFSSLNRLVRRVIGEAKLTFEEFITLTAQIEACLNSRPISPLSADSQDVAALTPGHFLIGTALLAAPEPATDERLVGVPRWKIATQMRNHFWRRWQREVLNHMQVRQKWNIRQPGLLPGELVLITDDLQPPQRWPLARVEQLHPGADGLTRKKSKKK